MVISGPQFEKAVTRFSRRIMVEVFAADAAAKNRFAGEPFGLFFNNPIAQKDAPCQKQPCPIHSV